MVPSLSLSSVSCLSLCFFRMNDSSKPPQPPQPPLSTILKEKVGGYSTDPSSIFHLMTLLLFFL
ncbi:hypothetical protein HanRHA438_Chr05g0238551 [Helianthus annuus]|uniref:Uncharacterized protein n=1 Tax=Helianthus annuus TaxID=4232 RepID=A0A251URE3_HELAN|nr:hypothetical protein HanXRQr2_Chr05g0229451 [Helianthus annuus]KAJ0585602.1 hypothetical protein HanHA89_Chr05g0202621 [Helianthus annuus]KAJ0920184.1 hypothetical protein HanRHA438_Chr05g0238551 [Helianthus annuus]KAJ0923843.1 hypothetical protein HanPSC8_Chr05g0221381 [Helianthus annuus]